MDARLAVGGIATTRMAGGCERCDPGDSEMRPADLKVARALERAPKRRIADRGGLENA
jgi:hypothetical protein